jgi:predicted Zn-dependent protease
MFYFEDMVDLVATALLAFCIGVLIYIGQSLFGPIFDQDCDKFGQWSNLPITYSINASFPEKYVETIHRSAQNWNKRFNKELILHDENSPNVIYWVDKDWASWSHMDAIGATKTYLQGTNIEKYSIAFNAEDFKFYNSYKDETSESMHLESIATHEFGHALGLSHTRFGAMQPGNTYNVQNFDLSSLDCSF